MINSPKNNKIRTVLNHLYLQYFSREKKERTAMPWVREVLAQFSSLLRGHHTFLTEVCLATSPIRPNSWTIKNACRGHHFPRTQREPGVVPNAGPDPKEVMLISIRKQHDPSVLIIKQVFFKRKYPNRNYFIGNSFKIPKQKKQLQAKGMQITN